MKKCLFISFYNNSLYILLFCVVIYHLFGFFLMWKHNRLQCITFPAHAMSACHNKWASCEVKRFASMSTVHDIKPYVIYSNPWFDSNKDCYQTMFRQFTKSFIFSLPNYYSNYDQIQILETNQSNYLSRKRINLRQEIIKETERWRGKEAIPAIPAA